METEKLESEWLNDFKWSFRPPICNWLQSQRQIIDDLACRNSSNIGHWMLDLATDKTSTMQKSCKHGWVLQNLRKIFINLRTCTKPVFKTETKPTIFRRGAALARQEPQGRAAAVGGTRRRARGLQGQRSGGTAQGHVLRGWEKKNVKKIYLKYSRVQYICMMPLYISWLFCLLKENGTSKTGFYMSIYERTSQT